MYAIACILSYGGLSSILPDDDAFDSQEAKLESTRRKGHGYVTSGPFLRSLISDSTRVTSSDSHKLRVHMMVGSSLVHICCMIPERYIRQIILARAESNPFGIGNLPSLPFCVSFY